MRPTFFTEHGAVFLCRSPQACARERDWNKPAKAIYNLVRGVTHPYPGAFTYLNGKKAIIWQAWPVEGAGEPGRIVSHNPLLVGTGEGLLEVRSLQLEGENEFKSADFVRQHTMPITSFQETP